MARFDIVQGGKIVHSYQDTSTFMAHAICEVANDQATSVEDLFSFRISNDEAGGSIPIQYTHEQIQAAASILAWAHVETGLDGTHYGKHGEELFFSVQNCGPCRYCEDRAAVKAAENV